MNNLEKASLASGALFANVAWVSDVNQLLMLAINLAVAGGFLVSVARWCNGRRAAKPPAPPALPFKLSEK